ncbi:MAG: hypothetical protein R3Y38_02675 [Rikenellaceae bacterium]
MNVESFVSEPSDMDARVHFKKVDQNGRTALLSRFKHLKKALRLT